MDSLLNLSLLDLSGNRIQDFQGQFMEELDKISEAWIELLIYMNDLQQNVTCGLWFYLV